MYYYYLNSQDQNNVIRIEEDGTTLQLDLLSDQWMPSAATSSGLIPITGTEARMIEKASAIAQRAHQDQKDKAGMDYILHPLAVSRLCKGGADAVISALLHDVVEDTGITMDDLKQEGFSKNVICAVDALTRRAGEDRDAYLKRVAENPVAVQVKLADLAHNSDLSRFPSPSEKDLARAEKYRKEIAFLEGKK